MTPTITDPLRHVFVYGTLRRGQSRDINLLRPAPAFVGAGQINGTLYHLGNYPGVRLGGTNWIQGEIYLISPELERQLDEIEEVWPQQTGEYSRQEVQVKYAQNVISCLVYEVAAIRIQACNVIQSGDWLKLENASAKHCAAAPIVLQVSV